MSEINWKDKCWVTTLFLVREDGKVLLTMNKNLNTWIPVGGHINPGETPEEAIKREVAEETQFDFEFLEEPEYKNDGNIKIIKPYMIQIEKVPHHNQHMNFIFIGKCKSWNEKQATDENEKLRWFSKDDLLQMEGKMLENVRETALKSIELTKK